LRRLIGIARHGVIESDGSIETGAQKLPGNWESSKFNLPKSCRSHRLAQQRGADDIATARRWPARLRLNRDALSRWRGWRAVSIEELGNSIAAPMQMACSRTRMPGRAGRPKYCKLATNPRLRQAVAGKAQIGLVARADSRLAEKERILKTRVIRCHTRERQAE